MCHICDLKNKHLNLKPELRDAVFLKFIQKLNVLTQDTVKELSVNVDEFPHPPSAMLGMYGAMIEHLHLMANVTRDSAVKWIEEEAKLPGNSPLTDQDKTDLKQDIGEILCEAVVKDFASELVGLTLGGTHTKEQRENNPNLN